MSQLLFAGDGAADVLEVFEIYETVDGVMGGVGSRDFFAMGCGAVSQVVGDADVEIARTAGEDIDPEMVFAGWHGGMVTGLRMLGVRKARVKAEADSLRE